jgi:hypothetical protein
MTDWKPATPERVQALLEAAVAGLHPAHRVRFQEVRVPFRTVPIDVHPGETVVVVAEHKGKILYYSDVEDGWELDAPSSSGGIRERGASQFELRHIMRQLFGDPEQDK